MLGELPDCAIHIFFTQSKQTSRGNIYSSCECQFLIITLFHFVIFRHSAFSEVKFCADVVLSVGSFLYFILRNIATETGRQRFDGPYI